MKYSVGLPLILLLCMTVTAASAEEQVSQTQQADWLRIITPAENAEVIGKKPEIQIEFLSPGAD